MRDRIIRSEFWDDRELRLLPDGCQLLFQCLWAMADREGRLQDTPRRISANAFPFQDRDEEVLRWLTQLAPKWIIRYQVDGNNYIQVRNWKKWASVHCQEKLSRIPPVPESYNTNQINELVESNENPSRIQVESTEVPSRISPSSTSTSTSIPDLRSAMCVSSLPSEEEKKEYSTSSVQNGNGDFDFAAVAARIWNRHPRHRKGTLPETERNLAQRLSGAVNQASLASQIEQNHVGWCASKQWKEGKAVGLTRWLISDDAGCCMTEPPTVEEETGEQDWIQQALRGEI